MPINKKSFSDEVKNHINQGRPRAQALAIAYSNLRKHGHKMSAGGMCESCGEACKYSSGGEVKGVHKSSSDLDKPSPHAKFPKAEKTMAGESKAGYGAKEASDPLSPVGKSARRTFRESAKDEHHRVLGEMKSMPNPKLKGLAHGGEVKHSDMDAKESKAFEEKGDVGDPDHDGDEMLHSVMGEFHESLKSGDHKGAVESLRALIHSIKGES